jgi:hypothetical protein
MTTRTWVGGSAGNDGMNAANWSPAGAPQHGDTLNMVTGTLALKGSNLAGDPLHLTTDVGTGPITLDLNGDRAALEATGSANFGDELTINVAGHDSLKADDLAPINGVVNIAANSVLTATGDMHFIYTGAINGPGTLTNNGTIAMADGSISANVNGRGTLNLHRYHDGTGGVTISGGISSGQTVQLQQDATFDTLTTLVHPGTFHGALDILPPTGAFSQADSRVMLDGVHATAAQQNGDSLVLLGAGRPVYALTVHNPGAVSLSDTSAGTMLTFSAHGTMA